MVDRVDLYNFCLFCFVLFCLFFFFFFFRYLLAKEEDEGEEEEEEEEEVRFCFQAIAADGLLAGHKIDLHMIMLVYLRSSKLESY
jgi:hypothetical protein